MILLFVLVAVESAGVPLPGETALIAAAVLADRGHYSIVTVIVVAALAAIIGDNIGYWIGRKGGRKLLTRKPIERDADRVLPPSERFFARHGPKTVFLGRFVAVLRVTSAWLAGIGHMPWWRFFIWNAAGGICWAVLVGVASYYGGHAAGDAINRYGLIAGIALGVLIIVALAGFHVWKRRIVEET